jgi:hypothetical protein
MNTNAAAINAVAANTMNFFVFLAIISLHKVSNLIYKQYKTVINCRLTKSKLSVKSFWLPNTLYPTALYAALFDIINLTGKSKLATNWG